MAAWKRFGDVQNGVPHHLTPRPLPPSWPSFMWQSPPHPTTPAHRHTRHIEKRSSAFRHLLRGDGIGVPAWQSIPCRWEEGKRRGNVVKRERKSLVEGRLNKIEMSHSPTLAEGREWKSVWLKGEEAGFLFYTSQRGLFSLIWFNREREKGHRRDAGTGEGVCYRSVSTKRGGRSLIAYRCVTCFSEAVWEGILYPGWVSCWINFLFF